MTKQSELFSTDGGSEYWERVTALALSLACARMTAHRTKFSRRDFTRRQQLVILLLRALQDTTYRGVCEFLKAAPGVRDVLGLRSVPHFSTLQKFADREDVEQIVNDILAELRDRFPPRAGCEAAMDATGLSPTCASRHYESKRSKRESRYVKVSAAVVCGAMLPCALMVSWGPSPDLVEGHELAERAALAVRPARLYADRGYDSERLHESMRDVHGVESVIPPVPKGPNKVVRTKHRASLHACLPEGYKKRRNIESFFSALKRMTGSSLRSRGDRRPLDEAALRVLAYAVHA